LFLATVLQEGDAAPVQSSAEAGLHLWSDLALADPLFLLVLPVCALALYLGRARRRHASAHVPQVEADLPVSIAQRLAFVPRLLEASSIVLAVLALARPLRGKVELSSVTEGIDIALLVDRSTSMTFEDLDPGRTRLDVVKDVVGEFARRRMTDRDAAADHVGLIAFARYPEMRCPFTLDVEALLGSLATVDFAEQEEGGTGVGIALAKAVAVLKESRAKSRIAILLTDGENNIDVITPLEAAELAAEEGIRVYTVFAGRFVSDFFGRLIEADREIDTTELRTIAEKTQGRFFRARDKAALEDVYAEIERLERTPREEKRWAEEFDLYQRFLLPSFVLYLLSWIAACTFARKLP
jgi:Ca-activated chloride channel family protein